jgi:arylsulfatase A-like enzyme
MFTGLRAGEHGLHFAPPAPGRASLSPVSGLRAAARDRLLARLLRDRGYGTIGISSNRWISPATELDAGFDHFYLLPPRRLKRERAVAEWLGAPPRTSTAAEQSLELLAKHLDDDSLHRPIFAFLNLIEPHFPYLPERGFAGRFGGDRSTLRALLREHDSLERAMLGGSVQPDPQLLSDLYDEELAQVDAGVGEIFDALRARGLYDDALIVVTSDHGEHLGEDGHYSHQLTMRPELLDVPLIVKYPHNAGAGSTVDLPLASTADVHQTLLAAAWPENPLAGGWSQNLARPEAFDRAWNVAEYYYSLVYLALLEKAAPKFERGVHERIRRVIFTSRGAHPIDSAEAGEAMPGLPSGVSAQVRSYIESLEKGGESPTVTLDAEDLEALRALGYVE